MSNATLLTGTSQKAGTRRTQSPASTVWYFKNSSAYSVTQTFFSRLVFKYNRQTLSLYTAFVNSLRMGSRMCYRLIRRTPALQTPCLQQESTQKELAMRRRVSLNVHRGLHAPGDVHIRSRCLFRVYLPPPSLSPPCPAILGRQEQPLLN